MADPEPAVPAEPITVFDAELETQLSGGSAHAHPRDRVRCGSPEPRAGPAGMLVQLYKQADKDGNDSLTFEELAKMLKRKEKHFALCVWRPRWMDCCRVRCAPQRLGAKPHCATAARPSPPRLTSGRSTGPASVPGASIRAALAAPALAAAVRWRLLVWVAARVADTRAGRRTSC